MEVNMKITKAVIAVAGYGTRFLPATKAVPKELFPIVNVPILELLVKELSNAGIKDILIVINKNKESIKKNFTKNQILENLISNDSLLLALAQTYKTYAKIHYAYQKKPNGFADAVSYARKFVGDDDFILCVGDEVFYGEKTLTEQLIECYEKYLTPCMAVFPVLEKESSLYGMVSFTKSEDCLKVNQIIEKPKVNPPSNLANIGRYVLPPTIFDVIDSMYVKGCETNFVECLNYLLNERELIAVNAQGYRFDTGNKVGFIKANIYASLQDENIKDEILEFIKGFQ